MHHKDFDPPHITLMSVRLDNLSEEEAAEHVVSAAQRGEGGRLVNPNVDVMRQVVTDRSLGSLLQSAPTWSSPTACRCCGRPACRGAR